jgi:hypothetical protein
VPTDAPNLMIAAIDSHYLAVKARIQTMNPNRQVIGVMDAQDWPPQQVTMEAFYCLVLGEVPIGKQGWSATVPIKIHTVQWTWLIAGLDVQKGIQTRSRSSRYRTNYDMEKELEYGMYPGFTQKLIITQDPNNFSNLLTAPTDPVEYITWTPLSIVKKSDKVSGLLYGTATTKITNMSDTIPS